MKMYGNPNISNYNNPHLISLLLNAGADIEMVNDGSIEGYRIGSTALVVACNKGDWSTADKLIEAGANVNAKSVFSISALHWTFDRGGERQDGSTSYISDGYRTTAIKLIKAGADIESMNHAGATILLRMVERNRIKSVELLIELGANLKVRSKQNETPLHVARRLDHLEIAAMLSEALAWDKSVGS